MSRTSSAHTARTILRSRVRRHPDSASVLAGRKVSDLSKPDLLQAALLLELDEPTPAECEAYEQAKRDGLDAMAVADRVALDRNLGGKGMARLDFTAPRQAASDETGPDEEPEAPATEAEDQDQGQDKTVSEAEALAASIRAKLGEGDFAGFQAALLDLAERALKPAVVQHVVAVDPSKVKGTIPQVIGRKTARQAGITTPLDVRDDATALDVYDAPDAPAVDPDYIWPESAGGILASLAAGDSVFVYGPAGTGKSSLAKQIAARWGRPYVRVSCHNQTEAATLTGMTVPDGNGGVVWQDGQLVAAIRRPGTVVLIDEPSVARAGALFVLQSLLDDDRAIHIEETGEVVRAAPGVMIMLADNTNGTGDITGQYEGTQILNRATLDRPLLTVRLTYLDAQQEINALVSRTGCGRATAAALVAFANLTRTKADRGEVSHGLGFRRLRALARALSFGMDPHKAFQQTVLETAPYDDREPLRQMWTADMDVNALAGGN